MKTNIKEHIGVYLIVQSDHGLPLYFNYDNDTTITLDSTSASAIAVIGMQQFPLCQPQGESQRPGQR